MIELLIYANGFIVYQEFDESGEHTLSQSQREVNDMLTSIKVVIGQYANTRNMPSVLKEILSNSFC